jgi:hypothetical protein
MRYFRSIVFDVGLAATLVGVLSALLLARDMIAFTLQFFSRHWSREGGTAAATMNLSAFGLATLLAMIGLAILVVAVVRARRGA